MINTSAILHTPRPWSFSRSELTAGLRRHTGDPSLKILDLEEQDLTYVWPSVARIRGVHVATRGLTGEYSFDLVLKEPRQAGTTRAGMATPGQRESGFYRHLADQVPVRIPQVFAVDPMGNWLIMARLEKSKSPEVWSRNDYLLATAQLAILHDRFWNLGRDLAIYPWLGRPLDADLDVNTKVAANAISRLEASPNSPLLNHTRGLVPMLNRMVRHAEAISRALSRAPLTLLHGDYWAANIHVDEQGRLTVYDWQQASIGPGMLDLLTFIQTSRWWFDPLPLPPEAIISEYRSHLSERTGTIWANTEWNLLIDHSLMWLFLVNWVEVLANIPAPLLETRLALLDTLWLQPVKEAVERHLPAD